MKICLVNSSYQGADSPFEKHDELPDPSRYIPKSRHEFVTRWVTKANAKAEIDEICKEPFDMFMNYMWGIESDAVAGVEATRYLESKGVPILGNPSWFLAKDKFDLQQAAPKAGLRIPKDTPGRYPKIVKYANACGSLKLDYGSICHSDDEVQKRIAYLQEDQERFGTMVQDYIPGTECSAMVIEMGDAVVALNPLSYVFPGDTPDEKEFLTWHNKFEACEDGTIQYALVGGETAEKLKKAAVEAFNALSLNGGGGWARVDMRLEKDTGDVYVIEVNSLPVVFYPVGNKLGDDLVIEQTFPGGHGALMDAMLTTKLLQQRKNQAQCQRVTTLFNKMAPGYNDGWEKTGQHDTQVFFAANCDFSGSVLDLGCGTGGFGKVLDEQGIRPKLLGIDITPGMLEQPWIKKYYQQPARLGPLEEYVMTADEVDHIVCFGVLNFLQPIFFNAVFARMFMLARRSITVTIDDLSPECIQLNAAKHGELLIVNHVKTVEDFGVPKGWKLVHKKYGKMFTSPSLGADVHGYGMRFERV